jgi:tripartite-type tricarboxylate transporter receptor subunit TctC
VLQHIKSGKLRALAVTTAKRATALPDVPTLDEAGVKGYEAATFTGLFAPAGIPKNTLEKLHAALRKALSNEAVRERFRGMGVEIIEMGQPEFAAYVGADYQKWLKVAREGNIVVE